MPPRVKVPKALSPGEEMFADHCRHYLSVGIQPQREYQFAYPRKWRFDFAWPRDQVAVEIEGGVWSKGRHSRPVGFISDCHKYNAAARAGWRVFRFTTEMVASGEAIDLINEVVGI